ncbi:hypothetical protein J2X65_003192 [Ancylobacter sp. 3268]|nr:hypothetical protein [Ancylobacter sp. 3268]
MIKTVLHEAAALGALVLFVSAVLLWSGIIGARVL